MLHIYNRLKRICIKELNLRKKTKLFSTLMGMMSWHDWYIVLTLFFVAVFILPMMMWYHTILSSINSAYIQVKMILSCSVTVMLAWIDDIIATNHPLTATVCYVITAKTKEFPCNENCISPCLRS